MSEPVGSTSPAELTTHRLMDEASSTGVVESQVRSSACPAMEPLLPDASATRFSDIIPPAVTREAVEHYCRHEWAVKPEDVMVRRSGWQHYLDDPAQVESDVRTWMQMLHTQVATVG